MNKISQTAVNYQFINLALLLLRITVSGFMITHAIPKMNKFLAGGEIQFPDPIGVGPIFSLMLTLFSEFFCSVLIGIGFGTRLAAIPLIVTMGVAGFIVHAGDPFKSKELALLYLIIFIVLSITGSGRYSVDYYISRKK